MKYEIKGGELPVVVCFMDAGETMITEKGSMSWNVTEHEDGNDVKTAGSEKRSEECSQERRFSRTVIQRKAVRDDRVCIQFSGTDQTLGDRSGKRDSCAKSRFSGGAGKR